MFTTTLDAINWIESIKRFGDKYDLSRMELACKILGNPEQSLPVIHVAGTNGKGSTVSYLKHILLEQGYHVGTFTSPYIVRFNERITYDYNDISDEELLDYVNRIYTLYQKVLDEYNEVITFFELITLISFLYFADRAVDFVIYEVGLGGKLDATNVVSPLITAITTISYDHMNVLGDTLEEIALNKLGIVKEGIPLVTTVADEELIPVFRKVTKDKNALCTFIGKQDVSSIIYNSYTNFIYKNESYKLSMLGMHQAYNASLAIEMIHQLNQLGYANVSQENIKLGLINAFWPGRIERIGNVILDGAHNIGGIHALRDSMEMLFPSKKIIALYTSMADKEYFDIIQVLETFVDQIVFTEIDYPRCETADNLYGVSHFLQKEMTKDPISYVKEFIKHNIDDILLVTGSLYFVSYMRKELKKWS